MLHHKTLEKPGSPPADAKVINVISGGSDICGPSYSAAKRHAKVLKSEKEERQQKITSITNEKEITFVETDRTNVQDPHHNGLVINLYIANHFFRRILVNGGSSVNVILLEALKIINTPETKLIKRSIVLTGFSGETMHMVGEINLDIYIEG